MAPRQRQLREPERVVDLDRLDVHRREFDSDGARDERAGAALSMNDDETLGYLLITVRRNGKQDAKVDLSVQLTEQMWPVVVATMKQIGVEAIRQGAVSE